MQGIKTKIALLVLLSAQAVYLQAQSAPASPIQAYLDLPLNFERQIKGTDERFVAQGSGYMIGLEKGSVVIGLPAAGSAAQTAPGKLLSLEFVGGRAVEATPSDELPGKVNRYRGRDSGQWQTGLSTFGKVSYRDVYPGIDVVYYGNQKQLEFDFVVKPGTDPRAILMKIGGSRKLHIDGSGSLVIDRGGDQGGEDVKIVLPTVYQEIGGSRKKIAGSYQLRGKDEVAFAVESWDRTRPLIIDPVMGYAPSLVYSGLIGGGTSSSIGNSIAVDSSGNIYIAGYTYASDFPVANAAQGGLSVPWDGFVTKLNPAGTALIYSTYLGGTSYDILQKIAVDSTGAAWVTGYTTSSDFPLLNATQSTYGGGGDAVVAKFSSAGALQFSTYLGGSQSDYGYGIATDSSNGAYVTGATQSSSFPTTAGTLQTTIPGYQSAFVTKYSSTGSLVYSTFLGGTIDEAGYGIAADAAGAAYVTGSSYSSSVNGAPGGGAQSTNAGGGDAFVAKLNPAGSALSYFTFLGGSGADSGAAIVLDSSNNAYITGPTSSSGLATSGTAQTNLGGGTDNFIAKLNAAGSTFTYVTYLGGNRNEYPQGIGLDGSGNAYVAGYTDSNNFPSISPLQSSFPGNPVSLFQTLNSGASWTTFDTAVPGVVYDISADPVTSGIVVSATENGIYRTTNAGTSWTQVFSGGNFTALARTPSAPSTIYALQPDNIYVSSDNGATWAYQGTVNASYLAGIVADALTATTVYAYSQDGGIYVSTNSGVTFSAANTGLPTTQIEALVAASDGSLYASAYGYGIYKSANQGTSWTAVNTGLSGSVYFYMHSLTASGTTIYAANSSIFKTTNGGANWSAVPGSVPGGAAAIGVSPLNASVLYASSYTGGVYLSTDGGTTWNPVNTGLAAVSQITDFAFDPLNASRAFLVSPVSQAGFVAQLNATGSSFAYSTWFGAAGGGGSTEIYGIATNSSGDAFLTGYAAAGTGGAFPITTTAFQGNPTSGAILARISNSQAACAATLTPGSQTVTGYAQALGISAVTPAGCPWSAASDQSWATVARGASDTGIDAITVQLAGNSTGSTRTATITVLGQTSTITQADQSCTYVLSAYTSNLPASGGVITTTMTAPAGCPWTLTNNYPSAVTITSGASGTGNGTITLNVAANSSPSTESFVMTVGTTSIYFTEGAGCSFTLTPTSANLGASGGSGSIGVTASSSACSWTASTPVSWITLTGNTSGTGNGTVTYSVAANSGASRSGAITIGGATFNVTQAAVALTLTTTSLVSSLNPSAFGQSVTLTATVNVQAATGTVTFKDGTATIGSAAVSGGTAAISTSALATGSHSLTAIYSGDSTNGGSTSLALSQTVNQATTTTSLLSSANSSTFGQSIAFTATVIPAAATGTITFTDGSTTIGTIALASGSAVLNISTLAAGSHSITATYAGDVNDLGSTSSALVQTINRATSTTVLTSSVNPSVFGANVTFTVTVTPAAATGTVNFLDGTASIGSGTLSNGTATLVLSNLAVGPHSLTGSYVGDVNDASSTSSVLTQTVNAAAATVFLTSTPNPSTVGQTVTLTGTVTPSTATGSITFNDGTNPIATVPLSGGTASTTTSTLALGPHNLTASYSGDSNFGAAVSSGSGPALSFASAIPGTILDSAGHGTGFTTRLPGTGGSIPANDPNLTLNTASGTLTWQTTPADLNGQINLASGDFIGFPLSAAGVTLNEDFSVSATFHNIQFGLFSDQIGLFAGTSSSSAIRGGVDVLDRSYAFTIQNVGGTDQNLQTSIPLAPSPGDTVTFTLSRTSGTWAFSVRNLTNPANSGSIPITQPTYLNGVTGLVAGVFGANAENTTVRTETIGPFAFTGGLQNVSLPATTTALTSSLNPSVPGQSVTFTATVSSSATGTPTGTITFMDGATTLGSVALAVGTATFTTSALAGGMHSLTAVYSGDSNFSGSTSAVLIQTVSAPLTSTTLTSSLNPSSFGQNVVFTALVTPVTATGSVTFNDGTSVLGIVTLSGGTASFPTAGLTAGSHSITASYGGDVNDGISTSPVLTQIVNLATSTISLTSSANPSQQGQSITLSAAVTPRGATGTVTFKDGLSTLGTGTLSLGIASLAVTLSPGSHLLTAVYGGDQNNGTSTSPVLSQTVSFSQLTITTSSLPQGRVGQAYGPISFAASGGSGSYSWSASSLPDGLGLSSAGVLSGTPTAAFGGSVTVTLTDTISHSTAQISLSLTIAGTPLTLSGPSTLGNYVPGAAIAASFTANGGTPTYSWKISGAPGLSVDSTGHVTGTAGAPGNFSATLTVTDSQNASVNKSLTLSVFGITTTGLPPGTTTSAYTASVTATGGTPPYSFGATGLPPGVTFTNGAFGGTPTAAGSYSVTVHAGDSGGLSATAGFSISITAGTATLAVFTTSLSDATVGQPYSGAVSATGGSTPYTWSQSGGVLPAGLSLDASGSVTGTATTSGAYSLGVKVTDAQGTIAVGSVSLNVDPAPVTITNGTFPSGFVGADYPTQVLMATGGVPPYTFTVSGSLPPGLALGNGQIGGTPTAAVTDTFTLKATDSSTVPASGLLGASIAIQPASPGIVPASTSVAFSITSGTTVAPSPSSIGISSSVISQNISYSATSSVPWLAISGGSVTPGVVSIGLNNAALALAPAATPYTGSVTVACTSSGCSGNPQTISVSVSVAAPPPLLSIGTSLLSFASLTAHPVVQTASLPIVNAGGGQLQINSVTSDSPWLTVGTAPAAAVAPGPGTTVTVTVDPTGLAAGYYRGMISVTSSGGNGTAVVTLSVSGAATMTLGPSGSQFVLPQGGVLGNGTGSFSVNASGGASVPFTATVVGAPWLSVTTSSGTAATGVPGTVGFSIDPTAAAAFAVGAYYGTIRISASGVVNSPQDFQVIVNVTSATTPVIPDPEPAGLVFVSPGSTLVPSQTINVYASSRTALPFQASASTDTGSWLSISPATGTAVAGAPGAVTVSVSTTGLAAGAYRGLVGFAFGSAVRAVNVTLIVEPGQSGHLISSAEVHPQAGPVCANAQLVPTQTGLVDNFSVPTAWPTPIAIQLFDTCGSTVGTAQIVATFTNGDPPLPLTGVNTTTGVYSGTWTPRKAASQMTITASASAPGYPGASVKIAGQTPPNSAPVLTPNGAGDVFNPQVGAGLGPGNIIQIYGSSLASQQNTPAVLPLPVSVLGTSVIIGGVQAPLFYVSPTQINAQIPFNLVAGNQYQLLVNANGALTTPLPIQLNAGAPALLNFSSGAVVAQHLDGTLVLPASPAAPGEYIVTYSSGLGATDINVPSGAASPSDPPANVAIPPVLTLNGNPVSLLFAGLTPGLVGLYQVNFQVPLNLVTGNYTLVLTQAGTASNTTVLPVAQP